MTTPTAVIKTQKSDLLPGLLPFIGVILFVITDLAATAGPCGAG